MSKETSFGWKFYLIAFIVIVILYVCFNAPNWITEEKAVNRIIEITGTTDVVVIRHSNMTPFFGNPNDVTFELKVDGKNVSARCTSDTFSEMVCRVYEDE